jgi:hypothetical protein
MNVRFTPKSGHRTVFKIGAVLTGPDRIFALPSARLYIPEFPTWPEVRHDTRSTIDTAAPRYCRQEGPLSAKNQPRLDAPFVDKTTGIFLLL